MINSFFLKHPDATKDVDIPLADDIPENDTLDDYTLTVVNSAGDDVLATDEVAANAVINTDSITITFSDGIDGENYLITLIATLGTSTTTPTRIFEMRVRSQDV